ncbi:MAG TPA: DinB family protein [Bryobacteraceae bacterium]|jgi:uncharacterized damage-inducible protein DinB
MDSKSTLVDLFRHQEWADAEHWRIIMQQPALYDDRALRERLHHIHLVQRGFHFVTAGAEVKLSKPEDFPTAGALLEFARQYHRQAAPFVAGLTDAALDEKVSPPWFKDPPLALSRGEALLQAAMHSQWHRGQNATRLRELGAAPPMTDYIVWLWKGRPVPDWPRAGQAAER